MTNKHTIHLTIEVEDEDNHSLDQIEAIIKRRLETSIILPIKFKSFDGIVSMINS